MKIFTKTNLMASAIAVLGFAAVPAMACSWGNACDGGNSNSDWVGGGGYTEGGGTGSAQAGNEASGTIIDRGSFAQSESGFTGTFRFAADACGDCEDDTNAVNGQGFTNNFAGSYVESGGDYAGAGSNVGGIAAGEGFAWTAKDMPSYSE